MFTLIHLATAIQLDRTIKTVTRPRWLVRVDLAILVAVVTRAHRAIGPSKRAIMILNAYVTPNQIISLFNLIFLILKLVRVINSAPCRRIVVNRTVNVHASRTCLVSNVLSARRAESSLRTDVYQVKCLFKLFNFRVLSRVFI